MNINLISERFWSTIGEANPFFWFVIRAAMEAKNGNTDAETSLTGISKNNNISLKVEGEQKLSTQGQISK